MENVYEAHQKKISTVCNAMEELTSICTELEMTETATNLRDSAKALKDHRFAIGVMGEFRRGKSTLINSLLGDKVVPSDILPCTATLNRVTYGSQPEAMLILREGTTLSVPVSDLPKYVTQSAADGGDSVESSLIRYPSPLCENGVDILDTPGLNDNARMDKISEEVIPTLDVVIMTITKDSPLSDTEARFLRDKLLTSDVNRMMVVLNKADEIPDEESLNRLLEHLRRSIVEKVLNSTKNIFGDDSEEYEVAQRKLRNVAVYPYSAQEALNGKLEGDPKKLEDSHYKALENTLNGILTGERAALELTKPLSCLSRAVRDCIVSSENQKLLIQQGKEAAEARQRDTEAEAARTAQLQKEKKREIRQRRDQLVAEALDNVEGFYGALERDALEEVNVVISKMDPKALAAKGGKANATKNIQDTMQKLIQDKYTVFSKRMLDKVENETGQALEDVAKFTAEVKSNMAASSGFDKTAVLATGADVITDFFGVYGLGGVIKGAKTAGFKGAAVGGGIGLVANLAAAGIATAVGVSALPMLLISCAVGTAVSGLAANKLFPKDAGQNIKKDLEKKAQQMVKDNIAGLRKDNQLKTWVNEQIVSRFDALETYMETECERIIAESQASVRLATEATSRDQAERDAMIQACDDRIEKCKSIAERIQPITEYVNSMTGTEETTEE